MRQIASTWPELISYISFLHEGCTVVELRPSAVNLAILISPVLDSWRMMSMGLAPASSLPDHVYRPVCCDHVDRVQSCYNLANIQGISNLGIQVQVVPRCK